MHSLASGGLIDWIENHHSTQKKQSKWHHHATKAKQSKTLTKQTRVFFYGNHLKKVTHGNRDSIGKHCHKKVSTRSKPAWSLQPTPTRLSGGGRANDCSDATCNLEKKSKESLGWPAPQDDTINAAEFFKPSPGPHFSIWAHFWDNYCAAAIDRISQNPQPSAEGLLNTLSSVVFRICMLWENQRSQKLSSRSI